MREYKVWFRKEGLAIVKMGRTSHSKFLELIKKGMYTNFHIKGRTQPEGGGLYKVIK